MRRIVDRNECKNDRKHSKKNKEKRNIMRRKGGDDIGGKGE